MIQNYSKEIINMVKDSQKLLFYKAMNYPTPKNYKNFTTSKNDKKRKLKKAQDINQTIS